MGAQIHVRKIAKIFIAERPFTFWRRRITRLDSETLFYFSQTFARAKVGFLLPFFSRLVETSLDVEHYLDMKIPMGGESCGLL